MAEIEGTVEPRYTEDPGTMKTTLLQQASHYTKVKQKTRRPAKSPCHKRAPLYPTSLQRGSTVVQNISLGYERGPEAGKVIPTPCANPSMKRKIEGPKASPVGDNPARRLKIETDKRK